MIPFHRLLIATAIVFCGGFGLWAGVRYRLSGGLGMLALTLAFAALAAGLAYYLRNLKRFLGR